MKKQVAKSSTQSGFMLIEVLIALAIFGLAAVYLVDGAFVASRTIRLMKDTSAIEQDLLWVRNQIFQETDYEKIEEGGDIQAPSIGEVTWETEVEMTNVLDLYKLKLSLEYEGSSDIGIEPGKRISQMLLLRPSWSNHSDFSTERRRLFEEKRDKIREIREAMRFP